MKLQEKLDEQKKQSLAKIPSQALEIMGRATQDLNSPGVLDRILKPGDTVPDFSLPDINGKMISSNVLLDKGPLIVCFYRGVW